MNNEVHVWLDKLQEAIDQNSQISIALRTDPSLSKDVTTVIEESLAQAPEALKLQLKEEYLGWGPLSSLIHDHLVTEIIINSHDSIWFEKNGSLQELSQVFLTPKTYQIFLSRLSHHINSEPNLEKPFASGRYFDFRVQMISSPVTEHLCLTLRRHHHQGWTLKELKENEWCNEEQENYLKSLVQKKANILIVGSTGSGKTSILNALLKEISHSERAILLEDTRELSLPNSLSLRLETRFDANGALQDITLQHLIKQSLRMRPDRLVIGEVRDAEAKDLILALSTGHEGSMGTLHAATARDALLRLEMLIQLGAPQWPTQTIRQMIHSSIQYVVITEKRKSKRQLQGVYKITSLEEFGFTFEKMI
ncbi:MAG: CpaF family protein [Bdellovibrionales bacterium]